MDDKQNNIFEMLKRVNEFANLHQNSFSQNSLAKELFNMIQQTVENITNLTITQASTTSSTKQGVIKKATLRESLRNDMEIISRTAKGIAVRQPGIDNKFRMPLGNNDTNLLTTANAFARDIIEFLEEFSKRELDKKFFDDFNTNIIAFEQATKDKNTSKTAQVATRTAINQAVENGMTAFREVDSIVRNKFRNDGNILSQWVTASHLVKQTRNNKRSKNKNNDQIKENHT
jgi:hypothetical protein